MSTAALLLAGGRGERLRAGVPKAFCLLDGVPLLVHGLRALAGDTAVVAYLDGHDDAFPVVRPHDLALAEAILAGRR